MVLEIGSLAVAGVQMARGVISGVMILASATRATARSTGKVIVKEIGCVAKQGMQFSKHNPSHKISQVEAKISEWLGKETKMIKNKSGDPVFMSNDTTRRLRFDFNNPHGDIPHIHIEQKINSKWKDATRQHRIYPFEG